MTDDDSAEARAARAAERRLDQEGRGQRRTERRSAADQARWNGFLMATAPSGWVYAPGNLYMVGLGTVFVLSGLFALVVQLAPGLSAARVFAIPGATIWIPVAIVAVAVALPAAIHALVAKSTDRAASAELTFLAALPFPPPPTNEVYTTYGFGRRGSEGGRLRVDVTAEPPVRPAEVQGLLDAASITATITEHTDSLRLFITVPGKSNLEVARKVRLLFHDVATQVLAPLHAAHPLQSTSISF